MLYARLFLWQFPHFMAIAWMYREDYDRAGYVVLPHGQRRAHFVTSLTILPLMALLPLSLQPATVGQPGILCSVGALLLSLWFSTAGHNSCFVDPERLRVDSFLHRSSTFHHHLC